MTRCFCRPLEAEAVIDRSLLVSHPAMIKSNSVKKAKINFWSARRGMAGDRGVVQISISEPGEEPNLIARSAKYGTDNAHNNLPDVNARAQSSPAPSTNQSAAYVGGAVQCCCPPPLSAHAHKAPPRRKPNIQMVRLRRNNFSN